MIRKLKSGKYRLYSRKKDPKTGKRRNLGTFDTKEAAKQHEREVQFFKKEEVERGRCQTASSRISDGLIRLACASVWQIEGLNLHFKLTDLFLWIQLDLESYPGDNAAQNH
jgi:hypothetical protein